MNKSLLLIFLILILSFVSCRKDFSFEQSSGGLEFSKQTVYLDTVFTNIGSSTYRLKVYNRSDKDISIPAIQLQKGLSSKYRLMVDGISGNGKIFNNVELLAKDSLYIFIETTTSIADANPTDFLYTDKIEFLNTSGAPQSVDLVTLVKDAYFIFPKRNNLNQYETINLGLDANNAPITPVGSNLIVNDPVNGDELHWTNTKPYVIYGYALVPDSKTLVVDAGARIYFHANSGLIVAKNATIQINGTNPPAATPESLVNEVTFEGDRLEPAFEDVPGQWGTIVNYSQNTGNLINHLTLKNATVGIINQQRLYSSNPTDVYTPKITITNSKFFNCSNIGILNRGAQVDGKNLVVNYCGEVGLACTLGGSYDFAHCTFNNNFNNTKQLSVLLNDYLDVSTTRYVKNLAQANFINCIIYGSNKVEVLFDKVSTTSAFMYNFNKCLLKFDDSGNNALASNVMYDGIRNATLNFRNQNPKFKNTSKNQMNILTGSPAINNGVNLAPNFNDILNKVRPTIPNTNPDIGAYQF